MKETRDEWRKRLGLPANASKCQQVIKGQDTSRAQQVKAQARAEWRRRQGLAVKTGHDDRAPVRPSATLAPLVIELDKHAAEMIVALREIFPHAEITIDKER